MDRMTGFFVAMLATALAACGCAVDTDERPARGVPDARTHAAGPDHGAARPAQATADAPAPRPASPTPAGEWFVMESDPPHAAWGAPASESVLGFSCDRRDQRLLLERAAVGVPDAVRTVSIEADGTRIDYPAERREATLAPNLVTAIALDAPIVDRLLVARGMVVTAGEDAIATTAPGDALRAVVAACRRTATP